MLPQPVSLARAAEFGDGGMVAHLSEFMASGLGLVVDGTRAALGKAALPPGFAKGFISTFVPQLSLCDPGRADAVLGALGRRGKKTLLDVVLGASRRLAPGTPLADLSGIRCAEALGEALGVGTLGGLHSLLSRAGGLRCGLMEAALLPRYGALGCCREPTHGLQGGVPVACDRCAPAIVGQGAAPLAWTCDKCQVVFISRRHREAHQLESLRCGKPMAERKEGEGKHTCGTCKKTFTQRSHLETHKKSKKHLTVEAALKAQQSITACFASR